MAVSAPIFCYTVTMNEINDHLFRLDDDGLCRICSATEDEHDADVEDFIESRDPWRYMPDDATMAARASDRVAFDYYTFGEI